MHPPELFETRRLRVRKLVAADGPLLFSRWAQDAQVTRFLVWAPHESPTESVKHARNCEAGWEDGTFFTWVLEDAETSVLLGSIAAYMSEHSAEMAYLMARDAWGHGYMTEAVTAVSDWCLSQPSIFRVWAEVDVENGPSGRVLTKAGFLEEGRLRRNIMSPNISSEPRDSLIFAKVR